MIDIRKIFDWLRKAWQGYWTSGERDKRFEGGMNKVQQSISANDAKWIVLAPDDNYEQPFLSDNEDVIIEPNIYYLDENGAVIGSSIRTMRLEYGYIVPSEQIAVGGEQK